MRSALCINWVKSLLQFGFCSIGNPGRTRPGAEYAKAKSCVFNGTVATVEIVTVERRNRD